MLSSRRQNRAIRLRLLPQVQIRMPFLQILRLLRRATDTQQLQQLYFQQLDALGWLHGLRIYTNEGEHQQAWRISAEYRRASSASPSPAGIAQDALRRAAQAHAPRRLKMMWTYTEAGSLLAKKIRRLHGYFADLYLMLQMAQQLRYLQSESERYEKLLNAISEGIGIADLNGNIFYANRAMRELTGQPLVGLNMRELYLQQLSESDRMKMQENLKARAKGVSTIYEVNMRTPLGQRRFAVRGIPLFGSDKTAPVATLAVLRDVTEEHQTKTALEASKQAAEKAQAAERQFLTQMSHEIRTPINAVVGMTHLLLQTQPTAQQLEYLKAIKFATESLMNIVSNVLDLSKIEAGELTLDEQMFSLSKLIMGLQHFFQHQVRYKSVLVVACIDERIERQLIGDATRLNQILANLLSNACKFTHRGCIALAVELLESKGDKYVLGISVRDTGIGIDKAHQAHIFENFKQAHAQTHREFGGTGLGLPIVKHLVEMQGGRIDLQSDIDRGSCFKITMPFAVGQAAETSVWELIAPATIARMSANVEMTQQAVRALSGLRVLIAEDNALNQKLLLRLLEGWNIQADFVDNGEDALAYLQRRICDVVLMDVHMPRLDGCEATRRLRRQTDNPNNAVPVIALTAAALMEEKKRAFEAGMTEFITKPFVPEQLLMLLQKYAQHRNPNIIPLANAAVSVLASEEVTARKETTAQQRALVFDLTYLQQLSNGDGQFIREILESFLEDSPSDLAALSEAAERSQRLAAAELLHKQQSTYALVGLRAVANEARELEQQIKGELAVDWQAQAQALAGRVREHYPLIEQWLQEYTQVS